MLTITQSKSAGHAKSYFSDALSKSDYYTKNINNQELAGHFYGRLADRINVTGPATKEKFFALCDNINPETGEILTQRNREDRTIGYDLTFSCPKAVSLIHAFSNDDHVLEVFRASVLETMKDVEADAMTRVRKRGQYEDRNTGELLFAEFTHQTSRPVYGQVPDPQPHSHCYIFNTTWDEKEQQIKAGQFRNIVRDKAYYQTRFNKRLSDKMIGLGYQVKATDKSFDVIGVPKSVTALFSKRTQVINAYAKEKGISDPKALGELGAKTRAKKQSGLSMAELKQEWRKQIEQHITYNDGEQDMPVRYHKKMEPSKLTAYDSIEHSLKHSFERASVVPDRRLLATAYHHSIGNNVVGIDHITRSFEADNRIISIKDRYRNNCTTKEVLAEEKRMVQLARDGQGKSSLFTMLPLPFN